MCNALREYRRAEARKVSGGYIGGVPPVPIPNTEVKPSRADGTARFPCGRVGRCRNIFPRAPPPPFIGPRRPRNFFPPPTSPRGPRPLRPPEGHPPEHAAVHERDVPVGRIGCQAGR